MAEIKKKTPRQNGSTKNSACIMGTSASTAQQSFTSPKQKDILRAKRMATDRLSTGNSSPQMVSFLNNKAKSIITNKVAPVFITYNCKEEFQIHDDLLTANYTVGRISDTMPEHYLILGEYFIVQDVYSRTDVLSTTGNYGAPNFRKAQGNYPIYGMGQPSLNGFKQVLQRLQAAGHEEIIFFCVREEPVVFLHWEKDFVSYTPRRKENLHENLHDLKGELTPEQLELTIRKELCDFAKLNKNMFYVYNDIEHFKDEPHIVSIRSEEDIHVTEEIYKTALFTLPSYRYDRLPLPMEGAPLEETFDAFISVIRETPSLASHRDTCIPLPSLLFSCQMGVGRTNLGMILGALVMCHLKGAPQQATSAKTQERAEFQIIKMLISRLPKGQQILEEVNGAIASCSEMHNIKDSIYENKKKLEGIGEDYQIQGSSTKSYFLQRTLQSLECYFYLIVFNAYLHEEYPLAFVKNFSQWMCSNAWLYRLLAAMDLSELSAPAALITRGTRVLVASEYLAPDILSTAKEMKASNFRRVPKTPVYGMTQPGSEALSTVLSYLTEQRKHVHLLWINLQEELVMEGNGQVFIPREPACLEKPIRICTQSPHQLQELEQALAEDVLHCGKWLEVILEQERQMRMFKSCHTLQEMFRQHSSTHTGLRYRRIPLADCSAPHEEVFDELLEAIKSSLAEDPTSAFVFSCHSGKDRTTAAMVITTLTLWHFNGFPDVVEEEIVSIPDAKYTKGEFEVVMQIVRLLPQGQQMKREVDMALDIVSETMTPMHYHLREMIICAYRKTKAAKTEKESQVWQLKSLQYLERYIYLILFNTYLHLEKKDSWRRPFATWTHQVAARAGIFTILNQLGFPEFDKPRDMSLSSLRCRWRQPPAHALPIRGEFI
ncbi:phosphatase domain containing paladin 1b isoform X2 [Alosa sapidissima]|uniref:phosphatase domain containing paladin 1b isoform X2 n=1 Tax=Alosa sapidissima TaxID=34773 RepID=UPI001C07FF3F|nr:phosphatase domain containing paladin 1b isoform X2 [Alosa sapidissima]